MRSSHEGKPTIDRQSSTTSSGTAFHLDFEPRFLMTPPNTVFNDYAGKSTDHAYTWFTHDAIHKRYKCRVCKIVLKAGKGPTNTKRHFEAFHKRKNLSRQFENTEETNSTPIQIALSQSVRSKHTPRGKQQRFLIEKCLKMGCKRVSFYQDRRGERFA